MFTILKNPAIKKIINKWQLIPENLKLTIFAHLTISIYEL